MPETLIEFTFNLGTKLYISSKVEKILKASLDLIPSPSVKIQIMGGKVCLRCKSKTLLGVVNKLLKTKVYWHHPAMFCFITSSKLSRELFELSLQVKVMRSNPGYLTAQFVQKYKGSKKFNWVFIELGINNFEKYRPVLCWRKGCWRRRCHCRSCDGN